MSTMLQLKPKQPERYNGSRNRQVIDNWIASVDSYFALTNAQPPNVYHYLNTIFVDDAATWFRFHYRAETAAEVQWATVKEHVKGYFLPPNYDRRLRDEWAYLRQTSTVAEYYTRFTGLAMQLQLDPADQVPLIDKFIRGLKSKTRTEVELRDPQTLEDATKIADRFDTIVYRDQGTPSSQKYFWQKPFQNDDTRGEPMQLDTLRISPSAKQTSKDLIDTTTKSTIHIDAIKTKPHFNNKLQKLTDEERIHLRSINACFKCRKQGHMARECPSKSTIRLGNSKRQ